MVEKDLLPLDHLPTWSLHDLTRAMDKVRKQLDDLESARNGKKLSEAAEKELCEMLPIHMRALATYLFDALNEQPRVLQPFFRKERNRAGK